LSVRPLRVGAVAVAAPVLLGLTLTGPVTAGPPQDRIVPAQEYTTEKARRLAATHIRTLHDLHQRIHHCLPWLDVKKDGIGFFKPKHMTSDTRYLSLNLLVDQIPSPEFVRLSLEEKASGMFSRYVAPLVRRMAELPGVLADPLLDGFSVILSWLKQLPVTASERPVHDTIAVFFQKPTVADFLAGRAPVGELAGWAEVFAWDGEKPLGKVHVSAWEDNFLWTYRVANYKPDPGVTCQ
jgi:hypothetical protein